MRRDLRLALWMMILSLAIAACSAGPVLHTVGPLPDGSYIKCPEFGPGSHDDAALEALLPDAVAGRNLLKWSSAGWCLVHGAYPTEEAFKRALGGIAEAGVDAADLRIALAGRSDTERDPPYFVYAMHQPADEQAYAIAFVILIASGLDAVDPFGFASDESWETRTVSGKEVQLGATELIAQSEHERGRPYVYTTDTVLFAIVTDDEAWAAEALEGLP
jgi:hypothetical protein